MTLRTMDRAYRAAVDRYLGTRDMLVREESHFAASEIGRALLVRGYTKDDALKLHRRAHARVASELRVSTSNRAKRAYARLAAGTLDSLLFELLMPYEIRDRAEQEKRWRIEYERRQRVLDSLTEPIAMLDGSGRVSSCNRAWLRASELRRGAPALVGDDLAAAFAERGLTELRHGLERVLSQRELYEQRYRCGDGADAKWVRLRASALDVEGGGAVVMCTDITRKMRLEESLHEADKLRATATLAAGVAHDFNNLLGSILGLTELCRLEVPDGGKLARNLDRIRLAAEKSHGLVRSMLDFSRQTPTEMRTVRASSFIRSFESLLRATLPKSVEFVVSMQGDGAIRIDESQMEQVLYNLVNNAVHAMRDKGGTIALRAGIDADSRRPGNVSGALPGRFRLSVEDTGEGIPADVLPHIFEPFYTTKPVGEGTGLGLSAVHGIVTNHGGTLRVESVVGEGSRFHILLPLAADESSGRAGRLATTAG